MAETESAVVEQPVTPVTTPEPVAPEPTSLKEHESRYGPNGTGEPNDEDTPLDDVVDESPGRSRGSRAKSKQAAARINKLGTELFEARQKIAALEAKTQKPVEPAQPSAPAPSSRVSVPSSQFAEPEPQLEAFADKDDPYGEWMLERAEWRSRKREHEQMLVHQQAHVQMLQRQEQEYWQHVGAQHNQKIQQAIAARPDLLQPFAQARAALHDAHGRQIAPALHQAIMLDEQGVDMAVFLATHPDTLDEFVLATAALPVTEQTVAITRRLLRKEMTAGLTGAVAPPPISTPTPRPPTPVRTGAMRTTETPPADDSMSLAAHERFFGRK